MEILIPTNISWLMDARHDWGTHYLGWGFYRDAPWTFPLGEINHYIYPVGTNVGFTDSIPLIAVPLKLFSPLLPDDFQYFGLWLLLCFLITAHYAIKIFRLYNAKPLFVILGTLLIACNPVLFYRAFHPALCAHWLLLASLYYYLKPASEDNVKSLNKKQAFLLVISGLVNPYLTFMVAGFNVILPLKHTLYSKLLTKKQAFTYITISVLAVLVVWFILGMLSFSSSTNLAVKDGYQLYGMNLNGLINSGGFSTYFPSMGWASPYQYEGYMYLGIGMGLLIIVSFAYFLIKGRKVVFNDRNKFLFPLFIFMIAAAFFAVSNRVTYNDRVLFEYWLPKIILKLGDTFRACGRVFWIPYYVIMLFFTLVFIKSKLSQWFKALLLLFIIFIQGYELKKLYTPKNFAYGEYNNPLTEEKWNAVIPEFDAMITFPPFNNHLLNGMDYQDLSFLALKNHKKISVGYSARDNYKEIKKYTDSLRTLLEGGNFSSDELYITTQEHLDVFSTLLKDNKLAIDYLNGYYLLYDKAKQNKIKFDREGSVLYKMDSENNIRYVKSQEAENLNNDKITVTLERLITNENSIITAGNVFVENDAGSSKDSVFITVSDGSKVFITQTKQIMQESNAGLGFSSIIFTNGFEPDSLTLGIAIKKYSGEWLYKKIGRLAEIEKTTRSVKKDELPAQKPQLGFIDEILEQPNTVKIKGWTFLKDKDATDNEIEIVFVGNDQAYIFPAKLVLRPDVTQYYNDGHNYDNSGCEVLINKKDIPQGSYKIGLLVRNKLNGEESLQMTDKTFIKR
ncbi:hypothetical protein GWA97_05615 [Flavobacterium sp. LaA7.5]|nr:hypothetical protein [Flavobacterium salilacus subsp. altitudinum]